MTSYQRDLRSAWAKHTHAVRRTGELRIIIEEFFKDGDRKPRMRADFDERSDYYVLRIKSVPDCYSFVEEVSLVVGEIVHSLRSALDHLAWQLACEFSGGTPVNPTRVSFPICELKPDNTHRPDPLFLSDRDWRKLHEFQPCKGANGRTDSWSGDYVHQLSLLHRMWNQDKHRTLSVVLMTPNQFSTIPTRLTLPPWIVRTVDSFQFCPERILDPDPDSETFDFTQADDYVEIGAEVGRMRVPSWKPQSEVEDVGEVTPRIALEGKRPVFATIEVISQKMDRTPGL